MSDIPFGFNRPDEPGDENKPGNQGPFGPGGMQDFAAMLHQFADMLAGQSASTGPLNWDLAKDVARHTVVERGDPSVVDAERRAVVEALRLADLWLDEATTLPSGIRTPQAWSRSEWIENTLPVWSKVCDPIAARMVDSMGEAMPEEMKAVAGPLVGMMRQMSGAMVGGQAGQALGTLALEVVGSADVGLPLAPEGVGALLPAGVAAFGEGLEVGADEVRVYLALREAAHQRLFGHVPWLRAHLLGAVEDYARGITVDLSKIEEAIAGADLTNPEALQQALGGELALTPEETPQQKAALARLETALALVEGWVGTVVAAAADGRLPSAGKLGEAVRRRRATGGPAERTFATLVGLELRPRRLREAADLWAALGEARGNEGRDAVWAHPDLMPTAEDLDAPEAFVEGKGADLDISQFTEPQDESGRDEPGDGESGDDGSGPRD
ncbi:zinc-dependent metalloprotease [Actinoallomurus soli]|uniref:zinc-dependent metalloprotease n=1 Tax=Actinoallomurus soli TaxID=2952535 RepID=UPI0020933893|nr:zinc-dependent metalloprotease [Actinoallomurus soli]MCO5973932.1 zinc-dependent metalloprotease [Actinoallomurus soli]